MEPPHRRYDLDWLRVIAILLVLYFHTAMIFTTEDRWHIKNDELSSLWLEFNFWLSKFRMPLLFFVSGVGSYFALRKRSILKYVKERYQRLVIPLIFSMFFIIPPQIYFERIFNGAEWTSFFAYYPNVLRFEIYPDGDFSWHHMWFVAYLFIYSVIATPIFWFLKSVQGRQFISTLEKLLQGHSVYVIVLPTVLLYVFWTVLFPRTNALYNDFGWFPYWFSFFIAGYFVACSEVFWKAIEYSRKTSLKIAVLVTVIINIVRWNRLEPWDIEVESPQLVLSYLALLPLMGWMWLLAILGYAKKYLNFTTSLLSYANRGIYPFYILHQTIIIIIGYYVVQVEESILSKFLFISTVTILLSIAIYDFLIKPFKVTRFLFGMKKEGAAMTARHLPSEREDEYRTG